MAALSPQTIASSGTTVTFAAASASDTAPVGSGSNTFLVYKNASGANAKTVTITPPGTTDYGVNLPPLVVTIPVSSEKWIPLRREYRAIDGGGLATAAVGGTGGATDVTVACVRIS